MLIASKCLTNVYSFLKSTCNHVRDCVLFKKLCKEAVVTRQGPRRLQDEVEFSRKYFCLGSNQDLWMWMAATSECPYKLLIFFAICSPYAFQSCEMLVSAALFSCLVTHSVFISILFITNTQHFKNKSSKTRSKNVSPCKSCLCNSAKLVKI